MSARLNLALSLRRCYRCRETADVDRVDGNVRVLQHSGGSLPVIYCRAASGFAGHGAKVEPEAGGSPNQRFPSRNGSEITRNLLQATQRQKRIRILPGLIGERLLAP